MLCFLRLLNAGLKACSERYCSDYGVYITRLDVAAGDSNYFIMYVIKSRPSLLKYMILYDFFKYNPTLLYSIRFMNDKAVNCRFAIYCMSI